MDNQHDLLAKIERLQKDVFWTKCVALVLFLGLAAVSIINWPKHPKTVEANEFQVTDRTGNVVARLGQYGFGETCLTLIANKNVSVANFCVQDDEGATLDLHNLKSESRATLTPGFNLSEPASHFKASLIITERGQLIGAVPSQLTDIPIIGKLNGN